MVDPVGIPGAKAEVVTRSVVARSSVGIEGASATASAGKIGTEVAIPVTDVEVGDESYFGFEESGSEAGGFNTSPFYSGQAIVPFQVGAAQLGTPATGGTVIGAMGFNTSLLNSTALTPLGSRDATAKVDGTENVIALTKESAVKLAEVMERVAALEKALVKVSAPVAGMGHNHPPEAIDELPLGPKRRRKLKSALTGIKTEAARERPRANKLVAAGRILKSVAKTLGSFCKKQGGRFVTLAVGTAAVKDGDLWASDIHDASLQVIHEVSLRLSDLVSVVEAWAEIVRHLF